MADKPGNGVMLEYKTSCSKADISIILKKYLTFLRTNGVAETDCLFRTELILRELVANALEHGSFDNKDCQIYITGQVQSNFIQISIRDNGRGFNYRQLKLDKMPLLTEKGRGLPLVNKTADELSFNESGNKVTVRINTGQRSSKDGRADRCR